MKKKALAALLLAGALVVTPMGGDFLSAIVTASSNNTVSGGEGSDEADEGSSSYGQEDIADSIVNAKSGDTIRLEGVTTLSNGVMKELLKKGNVTLVMDYTYEGVHYVITIPAGAAEDNDIPWYGPLYLAARYGNGSAKGVNGSSYTVQAGDTMSKIARANGMTLNQLATKNPQISDVNRIVVGQTINLK